MKVTSWWAVRLNFSVCLANRIFFNTYLPKSKKRTSKISYLDQRQWLLEDKGSCRHNHYLPLWSQTHNFDQKICVYNWNQINIINKKKNSSYPSIIQYQEPIFWILVHQWKFDWINQVGCSSYMQKIHGNKEKKQNLQAKLTSNFFFSVLWRTRKAEPKAPLPICSITS